MMIFTGERPVQLLKARWLRWRGAGMNGFSTLWKASSFPQGRPSRLRDGLEIIADASLAEEVALKVEDNGGVYLVPAFAGLGAPYWDMDARPWSSAVSRGTNRSHLVRAGLESIAYQVKDVVDLVADSGDVEINSLRVDGGASSNQLLMQFQSDILGIEVVKAHIEELSALGEVYMAGLCLGLGPKRIFHAAGLAKSVTFQLWSRQGNSSTSAGRRRFA